MKQMWAGISLAALVLGGLSGVPAAAAHAPQDAGAIVAAAKTKAPRFTVSKKRTTTVTKPFTLTTTYRLPVLKGSTARNRALVTKYARELIAQEKRLVTRQFADCDSQWIPAFVEATPVATAIHKGRYASVGMSFSSAAGCAASSNGGVRTFTLDLVTGKKVALSKFAAPAASTTRLAVYSALERQNPGCLETSLAGVPTPGAWTVSSKGLKVYFDEGGITRNYCGWVSARLPWTDVATKKQMTGKRYTRTYVRSMGVYRGDHWGEIMTLTVQGKKVARARINFGEGSDGSDCQLGVRTGRTARLFNVFDSKRTVVKLGGTASRPTLSPGTGWRVATAKDRSMLRAAGIGTDAIRFCAGWMS